MGSKQTETILKHMVKAGSISKREAETDYHIQNFSARMSDLRRAGYRFVTRVKKHPVTGQRYTRYSLV